MRKVLLLVCLVMFLFGEVTARFRSNNDTALVSFKNKPKFFLTIDRSSSFVSGKDAVTTELRLGLDFKKKVRLGIGFAGLTSDVVAPKIIRTENTGRDSALNAMLTMSYLTLSAEYTLYDSKRWQITTNFTTGMGTSYFTYYEKKGSDIETNRLEEDGVMLLSPGIVATYRILRWVGVSTGIGYRQMVVNNAQSKEQLNSPVYLIRVRIFMGEIYKSVFPRGILGKKDPPYANDYWD